MMESALVITAEEDSGKVCKSLAIKMTWKRHGILQSVKGRGDIGIGEPEIKDKSSYVASTHCWSILIKKKLSI